MPPGWEYRVVAVPWCSFHVARALNRCSVSWHSTVLLRAEISLGLPGLSTCPVRRNSLFPRRRSLRPSLSSAASRVARLSISGSSSVLAALCAGCLKGNSTTVGGAGGGVAAPVSCPVLPSAPSTTPVSRTRLGEAGLLKGLQPASESRARPRAGEGVGVGVGLIGPLRRPISRPRLGEAGLLEGLRSTPGLRVRSLVGVEVGVGSGLTGPLRGATWRSPAGASASGERTTHRRRWRFRRGWGITSSELATGGVCGDRSPNAGLRLGVAGGVLGGSCRARVGGCLGGVARDRAGGRERSSWAAASAE